MNAPTRPIRVVMAKPGLDSHLRGIMTVSRYLREHGMEIVYLGNQTPEAIARAAVDEDADVVGISCLSGNHLLTVPPVVAHLRSLGADDTVVTVGGIVPAADVSLLLAAGVDGVFLPGTPLDHIAEWIRDTVHTRRDGPAPGR
ncbi:cobalamin B12-binding domain-containing protein [Kitasatospora phosalacinea]|uniref:cobalamin B12-binding domain-containing protein n=1 Tax=Kitasatospora phosalacinea TaxID=2065 RepID=UPI0036611F51